MSENGLVRDTVYHIIENYISAGTSLSDECTFRDLGLDSLNYIEIAMDLESELNLYIEDGEISKHETVGSIIKYVEEVYSRQIK